MLVKTCILLLLACSAIPSVKGAENEKNVFLKSYSLFAPYIDSDLEMENFNYGGSTGISTYKYIRLTQNAPGKIGWVFSKSRFKESNFVLEFHFRVGQSERELEGDNDENEGKRARRVFGDGFALWLTDEPFSNGKAFGNREKFRGIGLFFDTFRNNYKTTTVMPMIQMMINDGSQEYDHDSDGGESLPRCHASFRDVKVARARLRHYNGEISVEYSLGVEDSWHQCFSVRNTNSAAFDPTRMGYYLGFSSATGQVHDEHDIIYLMTNRIESGSGSGSGSSSSSPADSSVSSGSMNGGTYKVSGAIHDNQKPPSSSYPSNDNTLSSSSSSSSSSGWSIFFWLLVIVAVGGGAAYWYINRANQSSAGGFPSFKDNKRF